MRKHRTGRKSEIGSIPVMDYEGSGYRHDFWEGRGREYEDAIERLVLRRLIPPHGHRIVEIGAGFGRLADLYLGYEQIVLFDYSRSLLGEALERWGDDPRFVFVAGNIYAMPFVAGVMDALVMVRVMHHLADVPAALGQIRRVLHGESTAVLEYANKRNLKAILRWCVGRQSWSPFDRWPQEFVTLNYDFHPVWMAERIAEAGLCQEKQLAISHFRLPFLKRLCAAQNLARWEGKFTALAGALPLAPSVLVRARPGDVAPRTPVPTAHESVGALFRCLRCGAEGLLYDADDRLCCPQCDRRYFRRQGIWDFKQSAQSSSGHYSAFATNDTNCMNDSSKIRLIRAIRGKNPV